MKALIAADLVPNKVGSLESQIFGVGKHLKSLGVEPYYAFTGELTSPVRKHFHVDDEHVYQNLGGLSNAAALGPWLEVFAKVRPDFLWTLFFPTVGKTLLQIRRTCPRARIIIGDHVSRGFPDRSVVKRCYCALRGHWSGRQVDGYLAVSQYVARRLVEVDRIPVSKVQMVYNGVDLNAFRPTDLSPQYLTAICHMRAEKGMPTLLAALRQLKSRGLEPECRMVGEGPELESYIQYCGTHGLKQVTFLGRRNDVAELLRQALVTVVPSSWYEAFGLAAAESLATGVPVIASNIAALPEVVTPECGLLVPPEDPVALADALTQLIANPDTRVAMGRAGRQRAEALFDLDARCLDIARCLLGAVEH